jgi:SAM-dependent methyltransferase
MLGRARARLSHSRNASRVTLHQGDMAAADTAPGWPFGMVLFSLNALMHLADPEVQLDALRAARRALRPGGQLVLDVLNPTPQYLVDIGRAPILEWSTTLDDGSSIDKWSVRVIHPVDQLIETTLWYDQVDTAGRVTRTRTAFVLRYVQAHELLLMLELAGFDAARVFGSTDLEPLTEASDRILAISGVPESPEIVDRGESQ